jgi:Amt family ammonium transporter
VIWDRYQERRQITPAPVLPDKPGPDSPTSGDWDGRPGDSAPANARVDESPPDPALLSDEVHHLAASHQNESTDLVEVLAGLRSILEPLAAQRGCAWSMALEETLGTIQGNRVVVRQILLNLCVAAIERGAARLRLSARRAAGWIRLELVGSGEGLSHARSTDSARAFDADRLEICRLLVEAQAGTLEAESSEAGTTSYVVCLPPSRRPTVLVVDDNPEIRTVFRRYLESAGADVLTAQSGPEGFELAKEFQPAAVTLDVMMASQDGWETLQLLRNHPVTHDIPVIICSVLRDPELSRFLGAAALLPKPIRRSELLVALDRCGVPGLAKAGQSSS